MGNKISIIVPVFNTEKFIRECLDSILKQTYSNYELLLVDDGSTDNSGTILDEYADKDNRIRVFHTANRGQSAARNLALENTKGEWIYFVDSDDAIESDTLEKLINTTLQNGSDITRLNFKQLRGRGGNFK